MKEHIESGMVSQCQRLLPCCDAADGIRCGEIRSVELLNKHWGVRLSHFIPVRRPIMQESIVSSLSHTSFKEGLHTLMQTTQHSQRWSQKS